MTLSSRRYVGHGMLFLVLIRAIADQAHAILIPVHLVETINTLVSVQR